ncbi:MAG TPA: phosphoglycolate phosphatase [Candidatus Saccharimonadia bacterium]|nr:phosphoglycolate phosphatase [Candidatus Saccharimonadia bacterium]
MIVAQLDAVLFDLDGTLADTAPDLIDAVNRVRATLSLAPVAPGQVRPAVSKGARAMLGAGIPERPGAQIDELERFLAFYGETLNARTRLFPGVEAVLVAIENSGKPWAIVTNKPGYLTLPLLATLALDRRAAYVVNGDTLAVRKPDPAPVRHACEALGVAPARTVLIGDDRRDVDAARAAGVASIVAGWGYIDAGDDLASWGADAVVHEPADLIPLLGIG